MSLPFDELARRVVMQVANAIDLVRARTLLADKLAELWMSYQWSWRHAETVLNTTAPKTAGTISLTGDPKIVQGTGTAFATDDIGKKLRVSGEHAYYTIEAVDASAQQVRLATAYVGTTFSAAKYQIFQTIYALKSDVDHVLSAARWDRLAEGTIPQADRLDGRRVLQAQEPRQFIPRGEDALGNTLVELSPVPSQAVAIPYAYIKRVPKWEPDPVEPIGPVLFYWNLNETSGTRYDATPNHVDLTTITGAVSSGAGKINTAMYQNSNSAIGVSNPTALITALNATSFTLTVWVKGEAILSNATVVQMYDRRYPNIDYGLAFHLRFGNGRPVMLAGAGIDAQYTASRQWSEVIQPGEWVFLAMYYEKGVAVGISVNNAAFLTTAWNSEYHMLVDANYDFAVGNNLIANNTIIDAHFPGYIDMLGIFPWKLSTAELNAVYNADAGVEYPFTL